MNIDPLRIAVIGSGNVGLVAGACFAELGHNVVLVDNDQEKLSELERDVCPIHEEFLSDLLDRRRGKGLEFSADIRNTVCRSDLIFIAVGTPPREDGHADLSYVESVAREIAGAIDSYKVIVEKSTVPVYTNDWIRRVLLLNGAPAKLFDVASNPEFLREGSAVTDFLYPDRIVLGCDSRRSSRLLEQAYRPLVDGSYSFRSDAIRRPDGRVARPSLLHTSAKSAELIKHASNAFLAMKISFINAVACICESVGAEVDQVCQGIGADSRIGPGFLSPGVGYGGSCFPKDLLAFRAVARENGYNFGLLDETVKVNEAQRGRFLQKVHKALWTLRGKKLAVLGLAFKNGTDDVRESPAVAIVKELLKEGCSIIAYDPAAMKRAAAELGSENVHFAKSPYEALRGADACLVLTEWNDFAALDLQRMSRLLRYPIVVDGRNLFDPQKMAAAGFHYYSIGRPDIIGERLHRAEAEPQDTGRSPRFQEGEAAA